MSGNESTKKKFKRPKQHSTTTTNPSASTDTNNHEHDEITSKPTCALAAKDSEWVDIMQTLIPEVGTSHSDEEEELQLVECEEDASSEPLTVMFPGLLEESPDTLEQILSRKMSTTEVTKHLVDLGKKADFTFMKKADRLIPPEKKWLDKVTENCETPSSAGSTLFMDSCSSLNEAESEPLEDNEERKKIRTKKKSTAVAPINLYIESTEVLDESYHENESNREPIGFSIQNQEDNTLGNAGTTKETQ